MQHQKRGADIKINLNFVKKNDEKPLKTASFCCTSDCAFCAPKISFFLNEKKRDGKVKKGCVMLLY